MEMLNKVELIGITGNCHSTKNITKDAVSFTFQVATQFAYKSSITGENVVETMWHKIHFVSYEKSKLRDFTFRAKAPVHIVGRIIVTYQDEMGERSKDVYIEAGSIEYLEDEKKEG